MAQQAWKAETSRDGPGGERNALGRTLFGARCDTRCDSGGRDTCRETRETRSTAVGRIPPLRGERRRYYTKRTKYGMMSHLLEWQKQKQQQKWRPGVVQVWPPFSRCRWCRPPPYPHPTSLSPPPPRGLLFPPNEKRVRDNEQNCSDNYIVCLTNNDTSRELIYNAYIHI